MQHFLDQLEVPDHAEFRRSGIYLASDQERVGLADFGADPQGHPLRLPPGKVGIASERHRRDTGFGAIPTWQAPPEDDLYPLQLVTPKSPRRTRSQGSNLPLIRPKAAHALEMHPQDAAARRIADGDQAEVFNALGQSFISVRLRADLMSGEVCLPEGVWFGPDGEGRDRAGSANMLTSSLGTVPGLACIMHGVGVEVRRATAAIAKVVWS